MSKGTPPLNDGEEVLFDHIPSIKSYKKTALFFLIIMLVPTLVIATLMPDSLLAIAPLFLTCMLLLQERFTLGRHRAWITNQRILRQGGDHIDLSNVGDASVKGNGVRFAVSGAGRPAKLYYPGNAQALADAINSARGT